MLGELQKRYPHVGGYITHLLCHLPKEGGKTMLEGFKKQCGRRKL